MKKILVVGAGRSANYLIDYLAKVVQKYNWQLIVGDNDFELVKKKLIKYPHVIIKKIDIFNQGIITPLVKKSDIVVSLIPAHLQKHIAKICLDFNTHLVTASYLPSEIEAMQDEVTKRQLLFLNEIGLDPGIDHMSAKKIIDNIRERGGEITAFRSFAGALVAPESDNNPWHYKFTWNPRNVVLAGQGEPAKFLENNQYKYIPYHQLFKRVRSLKLEGFGDFEAYVNRNSLKYIKAYDLDDVPTVLRGTIRKKGFCESWDALVQLGLTDNSTPIDNPNDELNLRYFLEAFLPSHQYASLETSVAEYLNINPQSNILKNIDWLGLFDNKKIKKGKECTSAQILQNILEDKWQLEESDKDMIVMQHQIDYVQNNEIRTHFSDLVAIGEDRYFTAIAKTVGLPAAIATELILLDKIKLRGVCIPTKKAIYDPVLKKLEEFGINFKEKEILI